MTRVPPLFILLLAACGDDAGSFNYPLDGTLRVNHVQAKGTHNSYHVKPASALPEWSYTHVPLARQLQDQGVRQFELDLYFFDHQLLEEPPYFEVHHLVADYQTTCERLKACLKSISDWSEAHPAHHPILILLEPKDDYGAERATPYFDTLEAEVLATIPRERILTPARVRGDAATLREAVTTRGWPTLGETRGMVFFALLDGGDHKRAYQTRPDPLFFVLAGTEEPSSAVLLVDDPVENAAYIRSVVERGFIVRTRADADGVEARAGDTSRLDVALASGAQFISTDYPAPVTGIPYHVDIPGGAPSRCNPVAAATGCSPTAVEDPAFIK